MKTRLNRLVPLLLCLLLCLCLTPAAFAGDADDLAVSEDAAFQAGENIMANLKTAIKENWKEFDMRGRGTVTFNEDLEIPKGMLVRAADTEIVIPGGRTLTLKGTLNVSTLTVKADGAVVVDKGHLNMMGGHSTLAGSLRLIKNWAEIPNGIWDEWVKNGSANRVSFENGAGFNIHRGFRNDKELQQVIADTAVFEQDEHLNLVAHANCDWVVSQNRTLPASLRVIIDWHDGGIPSSLTVAEGATLTVNGTMTAVQDIPMTVNGTLVNNGFTEMEHRSDPALGAMLTINGNYQGKGILGIKDHDNTQSYIQGIDLRNYNGVVDSIGTRFFYNENSVLANLKEAISLGASEFVMRDCGTVTLDEDIEIPAGMIVRAAGTEIVVPANRTLTVSGRINVQKLNVQKSGSVVVNRGHLELVGGNFTLKGSLRLIDAWPVVGTGSWNSWVDDGSTKNISYEGNSGIALMRVVYSDGELGDAFSKASGYMTDKTRFTVHVAYPWTVSGNTTIPGGLHVVLNHMGNNACSLTVAKNGTLTVNGTLTAAYDIPLTVNGTLVNNGFTEMERRSDPELGAMLTVNGSYQGQGSLGVKDHNDPGSYIKGIELSNYNVTVDSVGTRFFYRENSVLANLKTAIQANASEFDMRNSGTVTLDEDIEIPAGMLVRAGGTEIVVPANRTLTVSGQLNVQKLNVQKSGSVVVNRGHLELVGGSFTLKGSLRVIDAWPIVGTGSWNTWVDDGSTKNISYEGNGGIELMRVVYSDGELGDAFSKAPDYMTEHTKFRIMVAYDWTVSGNTTIPEGLHVFVCRIGTNYGSLTVAENATLTVNGTLTAVDDSPMTVNGTLVNNNFTEMNHRSDPSVGAMLKINGKYRGVGELGVKDHDDPGSYFSGLNLDYFEWKQDSIGTKYRLRPDPDFFMPASLKEIGEEAFAGSACVFPFIPSGTEKIGPRAFANCPNLTFIAIPESVTSIDSTAFANDTDVTIFGIAGSYAESFARGRSNVYFQPVPVL